MSIPTDALRRARAQADQGDMNVQAMNSRKDHVLLSIVRPTHQVGMFLDNPEHPQTVAAFRAMANAEFCKLAYEWVVPLLDKLDRLQALVDAEEIELATRAAGGSGKRSR